jgi:segregation and condensation protein B
MIAPSDRSVMERVAAEQLLPILESVLFASPEPLSLVALRKILGEEVDPETIIEGLALLKERVQGPDRGIVLAEVAGGWQFLTREECFPYVSRVAKTRAEESLSPATIETLAIVAYKQPVTRAEVDAIRGAQSGHLLRILIDRGLVRTTGRASLPGAPFQYGTTRQFLRHFGLKSLEELPGADDLKRLAAERLIAP